MITADQLWAAVKRGESDATIGMRIGRSEKVIRTLRKKYGIPTGTQLGTINRRVTAIRRSEKAVAAAGVVLPPLEVEQAWLARLAAAGRYDDVRVR